MLYRPRLANGQIAPLTWPLTFYRLFNIICWPLKDNVSPAVYIFDRFLWLLGFITFTLHLDADFRFLRLNANSLNKVLMGIPSFLVIIAVYIRAFPLGLRKEKFKRLLKKFYAEIYLEESLYPKLVKSIRRQNTFIFVIFPLYFSTLIIYLLVPIHLLVIGSRALLYNMITFYDTKSLYVYLPTLLGTIWVGFLTTSMLFGEPNVLSLQIFHLNGRYRLMRKNLLKNANILLVTKENNDKLIIEKFRQLLIETIEENVRLNKFAQELQEEYSYRLFVVMTFLAVSLCGMIFKIYTSAQHNFGYVPWASAMVLETIVYGQIGSSLYHTTDALSSMYYESKWEAIIECSSDIKANVDLMKLINLSMQINKNPLKLTGLNFFEASLSTSVKILQCAASYFTCLKTFS